ncbi:MAG: hypothetical protein LBQ43_04445 [Holosporales bacterium]|jgi:hypothetical protein|nr:hypothetical protein [Holosporales bacterium]
MLFKKFSISSLLFVSTLGSGFSATLASEPLVPEAQRSALQRCFDLGLRYGVSFCPDVDPICGRVFDLCVQDGKRDGGCHTISCEKCLDAMYYSAQVSIALANTAFLEDMRKKFAKMDVNADTMVKVNSYTRENLKANEERSGYLSEEQVSLLKGCMHFFEKNAEIMSEIAAQLDKYRYDLLTFPLQFFDTIGGVIECMKENHVLKSDDDERGIRGLFYSALLSEFSC